MMQEMQDEAKRCKEVIMRRAYKYEVVVFTIGSASTSLSGTDLAALFASRLFIMRSIDKQ